MVTIINPLHFSIKNHIPLIYGFSIQKQITRECFKIRFRKGNSKEQGFKLYHNFERSSATFQVFIFSSLQIRHSMCKVSFCGSNRLHRAAILGGAFIIPNDAHEFRGRLFVWAEPQTRNLTHLNQNPAKHSTILTRKNSNYSAKQYETTVQ